MGRGLSPQQNQILAALAKAGTAIPIIDLIDIYWGAFDQNEFERRFRAGEAGTFRRDRLLACRRAVDALERRGLVRVVFVTVEWSRLMWDGHTTTAKTERLLAAEPVTHSPQMVAD